MSDTQTPNVRSPLYSKTTILDKNGNELGTVHNWPLNSCSIPYTGKWLSELGGMKLAALPLLGTNLNGRAGQRQIVAQCYGKSCHEFPTPIYSLSRLMDSTLPETLPLSVLEALANWVDGR